MYIVSSNLIKHSYLFLNISKAAVTPPVCPLQGSFPESPPRLAGLPLLSGFPLSFSSLTSS